MSILLSFNIICKNKKCLQRHFYESQKHSKKLYSENFYLFTFNPITAPHLLVNPYILSPFSFLLSLFSFLFSLFFFLLVLCYLKIPATLK